jgi:hypothetical protein
MGKLKVLYDWLSFIFVLSVIALVLYFDEALIYSAVYIVLYTISVIILGFSKSEKSIYKFFIILGSLILPGLMPFIYYTTYLRGVMKKQELIKEVKQQTIDELRNAARENSKTSGNV